MPNQGRKKGEGQNQLQLSLCIRKAKASPTPPPLPLQLNSTQILLDRLDHKVIPTWKGGWESELLVLPVPIVQAGKGVRVGSEDRAAVSGRVVLSLSLESTFPILLLFLFFIFI